MISRRFTIALILVLTMVVALSTSGANAAKRCVGVRVSFYGKQLTYVGPVCTWWPSNSSAPASLDISGDDSSLSRSPTPS